VAQLLLVRRMDAWRVLALAAAAVVLVTVDASAGPYLTAEQGRQLAIAIPKPVYPESARQRRITGSGVFKLYVHAKTGRLTSVKILHSTGDRALDAAAVWALLHWRFKPGVLPTMRQLYPASKEPDADKNACVCVPVSFVLTSTGARVE
jgi:TonB family protein